MPNHDVQILVYNTKYAPQFQPHLEIVMHFQVNVDHGHEMVHIMLFFLFISM